MHPSCDESTLSDVIGHVYQRTEGELLRPGGCTLEHVAVIYHVTRFGGTKRIVGREH